MAKKNADPKPCAITRHQFNTAAPQGTVVMAKIADNIALKPKNFTGGSFGYNGTGKVNVQIDGEMVTLQVGINVTVIHSKNAVDGGPANETETAAAAS